jgi:histidinol dehydrogenase
MMKLTVLDCTRRMDGPALARLNRVAQPDSAVTATVEKILQEVRAEGDAALVRFTRKFDRYPLTPQTIRLKKKATSPPVAVRKALAHALENIRKFSAGGIPRDRTMVNLEGARLSEQYRPFERVGIYVPGGTAPLVSTVLMTVGIAQAAGVKEIVVATPPPVDVILHYALELAGATEVYQLGGAQAIGALAYGTDTIAPVQKIFGPGNAYVVEAKRQVFGRVSIDLLPGPSEIAIIADRTGRPDYIAADLLAQAEHGSGSQILFLTDSPHLLEAVTREIPLQADKLSRQKSLTEVLQHRAIFVLTKTIAQAVTLAEEFAPEHLAIFTKNARALAQGIRQAGAVFIGATSPVAAGDYLAGPSHTLPTGGAGKSFAGLTIDQFFKRVSLVEYGAAAIAKAAPLIAQLAELEQLDAHAASARIRQKTAA